MQQARADEGPTRRQKHNELKHMKVQQGGNDEHGNNKFDLEEWGPLAPQPATPHQRPPARQQAGAEIFTMADNV